MAKVDDKMFYPFVRSAYNYDRDAVSRETGVICEDESLTKQSFRDECDINTIVRNFGLTGQLPSDVRMPQYGDFTGISDYQSALNAVIAADDAFMELPAELRARFHHDPQHLLEFLANDANREEAQRLGLITESPTVPAGSVSDNPDKGVGGDPKGQTP